MSSRPFFSLGCRLFCCSLHCALVLAMFGPTAQRACPKAAAIDREQFFPYWTTETGWRSELQLRNNLAAADLTVTPALRAPDGTETPLSPVTVKPNEVKIVDIEATVMGSAPQYIGTYGSVVLRYHSPSPQNLFAMLMIHNIGHSIAFHIDATGEDPDLQQGSREGIWWLPNDTASDYLVLTNMGSVPLQLDLSLYDSAGREAKQRIILAARATSRLSVRQLLSKTGLSGSFGGIKIFAPVHVGSLDSLHVLFDEKASLSALLKMFDQNPNTKLGERDFTNTNIWTMRAPMLALSHPDPALAFPEGTTLQPQLFVRNTVAKPVDVSLRFNWRDASATGHVAGPSLHLSPFETRSIDVAALQAAGVLPKEANWASIILMTSGLPEEVVAVAASYDETLRYGAQTPFSDQLGFQWEGSLWEYDALHNSLITGGNGGTKPIRAAFTIYYNQGTKKYELEQTLQPDEQMWIDVGKLIREQIPDKSGNTLPADLSSGTYEFRDLTDRAIGSLFEGKVIYDKTYGHVTYGCGTPCCYGNPYLQFNPLDIPVSSGDANFVMASNCDSPPDVDVTWAFKTWTTANTNIATVNSTGYYTGVNVGTTSTTASGRLGSWTTYPLGCRVLAKSASGGDQVFPVITSINPDTVLVGNTYATLTISGRGFGSTVPQVNLPQGVTYSGAGSTDQQIILRNVVVPTNAPIGANSISVTVTAADGTSLPSNQAGFTIDGPFYLTVVGGTDIMGKCNGCSTAVMRFVTYQVMNFSQSFASGSIPVGETYTAVPGWSCTQTRPGVAIVPCSAGYTTYTTGTFTDRWSIGADGYTPPGCGTTGNNIDEWQWCAVSPPNNIGKLVGWVHTDAVSIHGYVNPPSAMPGGFPINP